MRIKTCVCVFLIFFYSYVKEFARIAVAQSQCVDHDASRLFRARLKQSVRLWDVDTETLRLRKNVLYTLWNTNVDRFIYTLYICLFAMQE